MRFTVVNALIALTCACLAVPAPAQNWARTVGSIGYERAEWVEQAPDGGYLVAGRTGRDALLLKLDATGAVEWQQLIGAGVIWRAVAIDDDGDGAADDGHLLLGAPSLSRVGPVQGVVQKVDPSGTIVWRRILRPVSASSFATHGRQTDDDGDGLRDDGFLLAGSTDLPGPGPNNGWLAKLDPSGVVQWQRAYGVPGESWRFASLAPADAGGFFVAGSVDTSTIVFLRVDSVGDIVWQRAYTLAGSTSIAAMEPSASGGAVLVGRTSSATDDDVFAAEFDEQGNVAWAKAIGTPEYDTAHDVSVSVNGTLGVAGMVRPTTFGWSDALVLRLDPTGGLLWSQRFGGSAYEEARALDGTSDGGFIVVGASTSFSAGQDDVLALRLDSAGSVAGCGHLSSVGVTEVPLAGMVSDPGASSVPIVVPVINDPETASPSSFTESESCPGTLCSPVTALIDFVVPQRAACLGVQLSFVGSGGGWEPLTLEWDLEYDGMTFDVMATGRSAWHVPTVAGVHEVAFRVTDSCPTGPQVALATTTVTITPVPTCDPPEVENLRTWCGGPTGGLLYLSWDEAANAESYNVYRGNLDTLALGSYDHSMIGGFGTCGTSNPGAYDPACGDGNDYYYLCVARNVNGEGGAGRASDGADRPPASVPCP